MKNVWIDLSRNGKIESKIRMDCEYIIDAKYSINVYQFNLKRELN